MRWEAAEFHDWFTKTDDPVKRRRAMHDLTSDQAKEYREWQTFKRFAKASALDIDPRTIKNRKAPEPDILCEVSGIGHYFELGTVVDEKVAKGAGDAARNGLDIHAGWCSPSDAPQRMIEQKCAKTYPTNGLAVSLLLHYDVNLQVPHPNAVEAVVADSRQVALKQFQASQFDAIWFFDGWSDTVLRFIGR
ncbi:MAG: hypothetical protein ABSF28_15740 [Terracidiphilus sp.]|jgi:hypothetical protein